jgi:PAS domain-containing protein
MSDGLGTKIERFGASPFLREAGEAMLRGDTFSRAVLDTLPAAVYVTDANGRLIYYNKAAAVLWGHRPDLDRSESGGFGSFIGRTARRCRSRNVR